MISEFAKQKPRRCGVFVCINTPSPRDSGERVGVRGSLKYLILRGQPGAGVFLLLVQKKVTKEKDPPGEPRLRVPCVTRRVRGLWNSLEE